MTMGAVLLTAGVGAGLPAPAAQASPGGDATTVIKAVTWGSTGADTVMCPAGSRAIGGGAAPVSPVATTYSSRFSTDGPVDGSGGVIDGGEAPGGWQVAVSAPSGSLGSWKLFATCSASSDVVASIHDFTSGAAQTFNLTCPSGRAVGGGLIGDASALLARSAPRNGTVNQFGHDPDGTVPTSWEVDVAQPASGRAVVLCSTSSDATLRGAAMSTPGDNTTAAVATAACPAGQRAVSGGLAADAGQLLGENRLTFAAPVSSLGEIAGVASGAVPQAWTLQGRGGGGTGYEVYAVCITAPAPPTPPAPPADTTPPSTRLDLTPSKQTLAKKAKFTFTTDPAEAGATFTCQLDKKAAVACTSPYKVRKLKYGKHRFTVTAKDASGNADATPEVYTWKVKRKPKPKPPSGCTGECRTRVVPRAAGSYPG